MRKGWVVAGASLLILVVDFLTLENRLVTVNPALQTAGGLIGGLAVAGLIAGLVLALRGRAQAPKGPEAGRPEIRHTRAARRSPEVGGSPAAASREGVAARQAPGAPSRRTRLRPFKVLAGLALLVCWLVVLPTLIHTRLIATSTDYVAGPWVAEAFLSLFALAAQCLAPTPVAMAFWPSMAIGLYFVVGRKDRPVLDLLLSVTALALGLLMFQVIAPR